MVNLQWLSRSKDESRDLESSLLPFQLAASLDSDEDTIYGLLRLRPDSLST